VVAALSVVSDLTPGHLSGEAMRARSGARFPDVYERFLREAGRADDLRSNPGLGVIAPFVNGGHCMSVMFSGGIVTCVL
jgi:hypothetical protein